MGRCYAHRIVQLLATESLIKSSIIFIKLNKIQLQHDIIARIPREHDCLIMAELIPFSFSAEDLLAFNHCRMYLRALFMSDITTGDGTMILELAWLGKYDGSFGFNSWPHYG